MVKFKPVQRCLALPVLSVPAACAVTNFVNHYIYPPSAFYGNRMTAAERNRPAARHCLCRRIHHASSCHFGWSVNAQSTTKCRRRQAADASAIFYNPVGLVKSTAANFRPTPASCCPAFIMSGFLPTLPGFQLTYCQKLQNHQNHGRAPHLRRIQSQRQSDRGLGRVTSPSGLCHRMRKIPCCATTSANSVWPASPSNHCRRMETQRPAIPSSQVSSPKHASAELRKYAVLGGLRVLLKWLTAKPPKT